MVCGFSVRSWARTRAWSRRRAFFGDLEQMGCFRQAGKFIGSDDGDIIASPPPDDDDLAILSNFIENFAKLALAWCR